MGALQYVDIPGYAALLLRRRFSDLALPGALMLRADEWLRGTDATWNENKRTWTFPSGAKLAFGYLEHEADKYRYKSSEFQFIGWDELTQFQESQYTYLCRACVASRAPRCRCACAAPATQARLGTTG